MDECAVSSSLWLLQVVLVAVVTEVALVAFVRMIVVSMAAIVYAIVHTSHGSIGCSG